MFQIIALKLYYMKSGGWLQSDLESIFQLDGVYFCFAYELVVLDRGRFVRNAIHLCVFASRYFRVAI